MNKAILLALFYFLFSSSGIAETCLKLMQQIDEELGESKQLSADQIREIRSLRVQGEQAYKEGNKEDCQKLLSEALDLLG